MIVWLGFVHLRVVLLLLLITGKIPKPNYFLHVDVRLVKGPLKLLRQLFLGLKAAVLIYSLWQLIELIGIFVIVVKPLLRIVNLQILGHSLPLRVPLLHDLVNPFNLLVQVQRAGDQGLLLASEIGGGSAAFPRLTLFESLQ